jgi:hypothetical protein
MASAENEKKLTTDSGQLLKECESLDGEIAALKARYEQYFLGIERRPPAIAHRSLRQKIDTLKPSIARTAVVKLKIQNIHHRLQTLERLWARTCQEMENGTYHRDVFKARLHAKQREEHQRPQQPTATSASKPVGPLTEENLRSVYDSFLAAKKQCQEDISKLTFESVASALRKQVPTLLKKHNVASVEFKVSILDGKAVLKAIPKKD